MGNLGFQELLVLAVLALIVFGPERLPDLARQAGKMLARFRAETSRSMDELRRAADIEGLDEELKGITRDIREVKSSVTRPLTRTTPANGRRADDAPPPMDPEAT